MANRNPARRGKRQHETGRYQAVAHKGPGRFLLSELLLNCFLEVFPRNRILIGSSRHKLNGLGHRLRLNTELNFQAG